MALIFDRMFDRTVQGLSKALDLTWMRNQAITSNLANAETPQYRALDVNFSGELEQAFDRQQSIMSTTSALHIGPESTAPQAHLIPNFKGATKPDGNNVDLDIEMGQLAQNSGRYSIAANMMRKQLQLLKTALSNSR